jgi:hypothetical protein
MNGEDPRKAPKADKKPSDYPAEVGITGAIILGCISASAILITYGLAKWILGF